MTLRPVILLALLQCGCAAQMATGAGGGHSEVRGRNASFIGTASGSVIPPGVEWLRAGMELTGRHEFDYGTTWTVGLDGGYNAHPSPTRPVGWSIYASIGTPLRGDTLFPNGSLYSGVSGEMLIWLYGDRDVRDINSAPWLLVQRPELVILGRGRAYFDRFGRNTKYKRTIDGHLGVGLRLRLISEYF